MTFKCVVQNKQSCEYHTYQPVLDILQAIFLRQRKILIPILEDDFQTVFQALFQSQTKPYCSSSACIKSYVAYLQPW